MHEQEEFDSGFALIKDWKMSEECISEEIPSKGWMTKDTTLIGYKSVSMLVCLYGYRFGKSLCIDLIKLEVWR